MFDGSAWKYVKSAKFSHKIDGIRGISIDNKIYVTGKFTTYMIKASVNVQ